MTELQAQFEADVKAASIYPTPSFSKYANGNYIHDRTYWMFDGWVLAKEKYESRTIS